MTPPPDQPRPARADDVGDVGQLVAEAYAHYIERIGKPPGPMLDDYAQRIANAEVWVIEEDAGVYQKSLSGTLPSRHCEALAVALAISAATRQSRAIQSGTDRPCRSGSPRRLASRDDESRSTGPGLVGVVVLIDDGSDALLLDNVAVRKSAQGQGIGRRLIAFAEQEARRRGQKRLRLYTHVLMTENVALYRRVGFVETGRSSEKGFDRVYMSKPVD